MAAPPVKAREDYDYLKFLVIGASGVGKSCILGRFSDGSFTKSFITTTAIDLKTKIIELDGKWIKLQIWEAPGNFDTITTECYRGAVGILLVYDVTDESSFNNIRKWISNIEQYAPDNVMKILIGNKADMVESKRSVPTSKGRQLADEYGIEFFETSAKTNLNMEEVFSSIVRGIKQSLSRLSLCDTGEEPSNTGEEPRDTEEEDVSWWNKPIDSIKIEDLKDYRAALEGLMNHVKSILESRQDQTKA